MNTKGVLVMLCLLEIVVMLDGIMSQMSSGNAVSANVDLITGSCKAICLLLQTSATSV